MAKEALSTEFAVECGGSYVIDAGAPVVVGNR